MIFLSGPPFFLSRRLVYFYLSTCFCFLIESRRNGFWPMSTLTLRGSGIRRMQGRETLDLRQVTEM